jgi:hypothetical protein
VGKIKIEFADGIVKATAALLDCPEADRQALENAMFKVGARFLGNHVKLGGSVTWGNPPELFPTYKTVDAVKAPDGLVKVTARHSRGDTTRGLTVVLDCPAGGAARMVGVEVLTRVIGSRDTPFSYGWRSGEHGPTRTWRWDINDKVYTLEVQPAGAGAFEWDGEVRVEHPSGMRLLDTTEEWLAGLDAAAEPGRRPLVRGGENNRPRVLVEAAIEVLETASGFDSTHEAYASLCYALPKRVWKGVLPDARIA